MRVIGNERTKNQVVYGESKINIGDSISIKELHQELRDSRRNLLNLRLFNEVEILIDRWTNDNHIDLVFYVTERWYIYPLPILELTGIRFGEWRDEFNYDFDRVTYGLSAYHFNLTKRGDRLNLVYKNGFQENYKLAYTLPGIDRERNWGAGFGVEYAKEKGTRIGAVGNEYDSELFDFDVVESKRASFSISRRKDITRRHNLSFSYTDVEVGDTIVALNPNYFAENENQQQYSSLAYGVTIEQRNLAEYPTDGHSLQFGASYDGLWDEDLNTFYTNAQFTKYHELNARNYLSGALYAQYLNDDDIPFTNLTSKNMSQRDVPRGYQSYRIFPKSFIGIKTEYRYDLVTKKIQNIPILPDRFQPIPFRILPKAFLDVGHSFSDQFVAENELNDSFLIGYGVGVDVVTIYNTPLSMEFSNNHLGEFNVNFGIGKSF